MNVGIRDLKAHLSEYVGRAADGEQIVVTDRGRPVAQLTALAGQSALDRGVEEGWIEPARRAHLGPVARVTATRSVADVIDEDRG
ncbi:MAG: prevent-host-death family protein [Candidatus Aldehydirespiratoraceae bacterium]|jgi:prevent-host-death family protein